MGSKRVKGETRSKKTSVDSPAAVEKQIDDIRARLATMRELFPGEPSASEYGPRWSDDELARFEAAHGVTRPAAYRAFLREIGDGGANFLWTEKSWERGMVSLRDASSEDLAHLSNPFPLTSAKKDLPGGKLDGLFMIGIGDTQSMGGEYLVITGKAAGAIWTDNRGVDTGKFEPVGPFLKVHLDWLDQRIAEERERRAPPDPTVIANLPPAKQIRALCTAKNTALVGSPPYDLAGLLDLFVQVSPDERYWENLFDVASAIREDVEGPPERARHYPSTESWRRIKGIDSVNGLTAVFRSIENEDNWRELELTDENRESAASLCAELARIERVVERPSVGERYLKRLAERAGELGPPIA